MFVDKNPSIETFWRSIILLGRNTASYKFSLAKTLLELPTEDSFVELDDLALPFSKHITEHLKTNDKQATGSSNTYLDACRKFNRDEIALDELLQITKKQGFRYVLDAFHNVAQSETPKFFEGSSGKHKGLTLTDNFYELMKGKQSSNLNFEVNSRWRLWETAISLDINPKLIEIHPDEDGDTLFVFNDKTKRVDVTSSREALSGYQKGKCFYCRQGIRIEQGLNNSCDVDHLFPHILTQFGVFNLNQVWNLVLSCRECNRGKGGKFERIAHISFLEKLNIRNNYYIESHHPLRETIINQTGKRDSDRHRFLQKMYDEASTFLPSKERWRPPRL
jgi:5-methylcytosine-specific restriction endonuclease McrA